MTNWSITNGKLPEARSLFRQDRRLGEEFYLNLLKSYGEDGNIYFWRAEDYRKIGEYDLVLQDFQCAERFFPLDQYKEKAHKAYLEVQDTLASISKKPLQKNPPRDMVSIILQAFPNPPMPEDVLPKGVVRDSAEYRLFLTLVVAIDYQRKADDLWDLARKAFANPTYRSLFNPREVIRRNPIELRRDLLVSGFLMGQDDEREDKDLYTWTTLSRTFLEQFGGDPLNLFLAHGMDATAVLDYIRKEGKFFPYLKGKKIGPLWIRMMRDNAGLTLKNLEPVPIPVDVHIERVTQCVVRGAETGSELSNKQQVPALWRAAVKGHVIQEGEKIRPMVSLDIDKALWRFGQSFCNSKDPPISCPLSPQCGRGKRDDRQNARDNSNPNKAGDSSSFSLPRIESFPVTSRKPSDPGQLSPPRVLGVLACTKTKIWDKNPNAGPTPARIAYIGERFCKDLKIVEAHTTRWVILSSLYGFINPDCVIPEKYNVTFNKPFDATENRTVSMDDLIRQIREKNLDSFDVVLLFSSCWGEEYEKQVQKAFNNFPVTIEHFRQGGF